MKTMIPLRCVAIASNVVFMTYGLTGRIYPVFVLHAVLLPLNLIRLRQVRTLIRRVREASRGDLSMEWLLPLMTRQRIERGQVLFRKGDPASSMYPSSQPSPAGRGSRGGRERRVSGDSLSENLTKEDSMRARNILGVAAMFVVAAAVLAQAAGEAKMKSAPKSSAGGLVVMPAVDMKWTDLDPAGAPGVKIADAWGDHTKGAFGAFVKFPPGFVTPLHTHTNAFKIVVVSGTFVQVPEGKPELRLGPGSYMMQPGGNYRHTTSCDKASECVFFTQANGKFDLKPVGVPAKKM